jgi:hypothetical protein
VICWKFGLTIGWPKQCKTSVGPNASSTSN